MSTIQTNPNTSVTNTAKLQEVLNRQIAGWSVLYTKLHNFHWYVKGPHFFTLHAKFEELYNLATANMDEVAERLLTIGGRPVATIAEQLRLSPIVEAQGQLSAEEMVEHVVADLNAMLDVIRQGIHEAGEAEDNATEDMMIGFTAALDKEIWMLNAFLGK
ncbi:starvation-inducible DNA-binding protein [Paenibacillus intestini]|uniref:DNA starvation/stationary phase protection protein n=1 Tax=Paenibacillus cucumis (ex Kampfer et al. 2016) TaxID=1776858 RepID=A0ABS7KLU8_9BACL|nr:DNA starvation/stationary phase protection protein [Paenibacillus cucumis (ex Kampfer et al. 2016)]MBY0205132.1 DNA starvation/stationary phase protection protein [Paenibacillus cucumis (ex Kampfer et al. 2016)]MDP9700051.1 starvation-inducible DNA-binding protein [Paenibacillus intestini]